MFEVIDTLNGKAVVSTHPTHRKALNASRRLEAEPSVVRDYKSAHTGKLARDWRYQVRPQAPQRPTVTLNGALLTVHTFQTGRLYTAAGQRCAWVLMRDGVAYLCDRDRLVDYVLSVPKHAGGAPSNSSVLNAYDFGSQPVFDAKLWSDARALFDSLMAIAGELPAYQKGDAIVRR